MLGRLFRIRDVTEQLQQCILRSPVRARFLASQLTDARAISKGIKSLFGLVFLVCQEDVIRYGVYGR